MNVLLRLTFKGCIGLRPDRQTDAKMLSWRGKEIRLDAVYGLQGLKRPALNRAFSRRLKISVTTVVCSPCEYWS